VVDNLGYDRGVTSGAGGATPRRDDRVEGSLRRPAGMCLGPGHLVVYGNPAFIDQFGSATLGLPAREGLLGFPPEAFDLLDAVLDAGRPRARWIRLADEDWRMTAAPRTELGTGLTYGVSFPLRRRSDEPVLLSPAPPER